MKVPLIVFEHHTHMPGLYQHIEWLRFVAANRKGKNEPDDYDVISGPVANDQTMPVIDLYLDGMITGSLRKYTITTKCITRSVLKMLMKI